MQEKFAASYRAAAKPGPQTERACEMVKAFVASNLAAARRAA